MQEIIPLINSLIYLVNNRCSNSCVEKWDDDNLISWGNMTCNTCLAGKNILQSCIDENDCECDDDDIYCKNYDSIENRLICTDIGRLDHFTLSKICKHGLNVAKGCTNENDCPCASDDTTCNNASKKCDIIDIVNGCYGQKQMNTE